MWLSPDSSRILTAACFSGDNVSLWTGARSSSLGDNFWISLNSLATVLLFPICDHARPWFRFSTRASSVAELAFCLVALTRATLVICSVLLLFSSVNCDYVECWYRLARFWQMLTDFHGRANHSFALWEQRISSKAWALSVVPHFSLSPPRVAFSCVGWFSQALAFPSLYYPWGKMGDYSWSRKHNNLSAQNVITFLTHNVNFIQ